MAASVRVCPQQSLHCKKMSQIGRHGRLRYPCMTSHRPTCVCFWGLFRQAGHSKVPRAFFKVHDLCGCFWSVSPDVNFSDPIHLWRTDTERMQIINQKSYQESWQLKARHSVTSCKHSTKNDQISQIEACLWNWWWIKGKGHTSRIFQVKHQKEIVTQFTVTNARA